MKLTLNNSAEKSSLFNTLAVKDFARVKELPGNFGELILEHVSVHGLYGTGGVFTVLAQKDGHFKSHSKNELVAEFDRVKSIPEVLPYLAITALLKAMICNKNKYNTEDKIKSVARMADLAFMLDPQGLDPILENVNFNEKNMAAIVDLMAHGADYPGLDEQCIRQAAKCLEGLNVPHAEEMVMEYLKDEKSALNITSNIKPEAKSSHRISHILNENKVLHGTDYSRIEFKNPSVVSDDMKEIYSALRPERKQLHREFSKGASLPENLAEKLRNHIHSYGLTALANLFEMVKLEDDFFANYSKIDLHNVVEDLKKDTDSFRHLAVAALATALQHSKERHERHTPQYQSFGELASILYGLDNKIEDIFKYPGYGSYAMNAMIDLVVYGTSHPTVKHDLIEISAKALESLGVNHASSLIMEYYDLAKGELSGAPTPKEKHRHDDGMQP